MTRIGGNRFRALPVLGLKVTVPWKLHESSHPIDEFKSPHPASPRTRPAVRSKQIVPYYLYNYTSSSYIYICCRIIYIYIYHLI